MKVYKYITNELKTALISLLLLSLLACGLQSENANKVKEEQTAEVIKEKAAVPCTPKVCFVYYFDFEIDRAYGLHEKSMEEYGAKYYFDKNDLKQIIERELKNSRAYTGKDVRVEIILHDKHYFIDTSGYMRSDDKYYNISIPKFMEIIIEKDAIERGELRV